MRKADAYLLDIVEAADRVASYVTGMQRADFMANEMAQAAVVREVEIMGEAAGHVADEVRAAHAEVPWAELARLRDFYIHVYHGIDYRLVWRTATVTIPRVAAAARAILPSLPADDA
jgi:uncharacterized protein with HEPN domain